MANVLCADGTTYEQTDLSMTALKKIVGENLKSSPLAEGRLMLSNEDGKLLGLPFNNQATHLLHESGAEFWETVMGDVVICFRDEIA